MSWPRILPLDGGAPRDPDYGFREAIAVRYALWGAIRGPPSRWKPSAARRSSWWSDGGLGVAAGYNRGRGGLERGASVLAPHPSDAVRPEER